VFCIIVRARLGARTIIKKMLLAKLKKQFLYSASLRSRELDRSRALKLAL